MSGLADGRMDVFLRRLTVSTEPSLVENLVREMLSERPVEFLAELLSALGKRALEERARIVYSSMLRVAVSSDSLPESVRQGVYSILASRGEAALIRHFLPVSPRRKMREAEAPYDAMLDDMSLGMKKWKARLHNRDLLLRLGRDANPAVLANLLDNPLLREEDVILWAARRPNNAEALMLIGLHRKWSLRPRIQQAIARNPYTPTHLAAAYLPLVPRTILSEMEHDRTLHDLVREGAQDVLAIRSRSRSTDDTE